ncbi:MAG: hypothetical protein JXA57_16925 [Armatimonadetes bacterium]|nr:hypothetical protein [Armatimonadota bacterium]
MAQSDRFLEAIRQEPGPMCDDCVAEAAGWANRRSARLAGIGLEHEGHAIRNKGRCARCGKYKTVSWLATDPPPAWPEGIVIAAEVRSSDTGGRLRRHEGSAQSAAATMNLEDAAKHLRAVESGDLTRRLASLERGLQGQTAGSVASLCEEIGITDSTMQAALVLKAAAGQINVVIHAVGILTALPRILHSGELVESLSLGAGNTGRSFDLETTRRVAEFEFIEWQGGPESIRQNSLFKDFFYLAEADTVKDRYLYLLELDHPLRFLNGSRALASIFSRDQRLRDDFATLYGDQFVTVREYYLHRRDRVQLCNLRELIPGFATVE